MIQLLYIDLFCGAGGTSTGVNEARLNGEQCAKVIACVNHDPKAIASHAANHPGALHFTEDIRTLNLTPLIQRIKACRHENPQALIVLWASLECTNFSRAKGGQPRDADSRTLAEHLYRYIEAIDPDFIQIENVEEFMSWGPLDKNGRPLSMDKGRDYIRWIKNVKGYGYNYDYRILNSADFGARTTRKRYFGMFAKKDLPIVFPKPTHSRRPTGNLEQWRAVRYVLNLDEWGQSIFTRKKPLAEKTLMRIYAGLIKFVAGGKDAFLVKFNSMSQRGKYVPPSIDEPCPTVATQNRLGLAHVEFLSKQFSGSTYDKNVSLDEPAGTITCVDHHALISAHFLTSFYGNGGCRDIDSPAPTIPTKDKFALVNPQFIDMQYGQGRPTSIEEPAGCITANPKHHLITAEQWIMDTSYNNVGSGIDEPCKVITADRHQFYLMNPQFFSAGSSIDEPCFTLIARMDKRPPYLVCVEGGGIGIEVYETDSPMTVKIKEFMALYNVVDIKMRMLKVVELKRIQGFPDDYVLMGNQSDQKKFIGNAVHTSIPKAWCPALCRALQESPTQIINNVQEKGRASAVHIA